MDPVTQGALGAACAQAVLYRFDKKNAWIAGMLAGMAPDLDVLIRSPHDPMLSLLYHRQFTHALTFIPVGGLLVFLALQLFSRFRINRTIIFVACLIGYATHGVLDALTTYGTVLLWPFTFKRFAFDVMSIIDPLVTIPLILGVVWSQVFEKPRGVRVGLFIALLTLILNIIQHQRAEALVQAYAEKKHLVFVKLRVLPNLASSTSWRALAYHDKKLYIFQLNVPIFSQGQIQNMAKLKAFKASQLPENIEQMGAQHRDYQVFRWFSDNYLVSVQDNPLIIVDGRYISGHPLYALWGILFKANQKHIERVGNIKIPKEAITYENCISCNR